MRSLLALSALLLAASASAQPVLGLKAGLNTAYFTGDDADGTDPRLGFVGGALLRFDVTPSVGLQVEALYSQEGAEDLDGTYKLDYVDVPVLLRLGVPVSRYADAGVYAGPSIGIPVRSTFEGDGGTEVDEETETDFGVAAGVDFWSGAFGVDLRYTAGLRDTFSDEIAGLEVAPLDIRNQAFSVTLGYRFGGPSGPRARY